MAQEYGREETLDCSQRKGSLPFPNRKAGTLDSSNPIKHIIIIMQENHSFDNYFGALSEPQHYGSEVDGLRANLKNVNSRGDIVYVHHAANQCMPDPDHTWEAMHAKWNDGKMDGFVKHNSDGAFVMSYFNESDLPYYYALADRFAIGDRYFSSVLGPTYPNRFFLLAGTAFGETKTADPEKGHTQKTIFESLIEHGISWKYYKDEHGYLELFRPFYDKNLDKMAAFEDYENDLRADRMPQVSLVDFNRESENEHPADGGIQVGQSLVADKINALIKSPVWKKSALFLVYDEAGGFYDHVAPPPACVPDNILPNIPNQAYDRLGFRVPFVLVSPFAKEHFVSHITYDHTSLLKFIEKKFNLPALSARDANANSFEDMFDFKTPKSSVVLPDVSIDPRIIADPKLRARHGCD